MRMLMWLEALGQDLRYAVRMLRRSRAFTIAAVISLALGIGATTMVFSAIHGIVIEPFPYKDPDTLMSVNVRDAHNGGAFGSLYSIDDYLDLAEQTRVFEDVIVSTNSDVLMIGTGEPERLRGNYMSMNTFDVMGVRPLLGRGALEGDAKPEAAPIAVLSYNFWQRRFGGDPQVLGQTLRLNGTVRTVVGVMPPRFLWRGADVYLPVVFHRGQPIEAIRIVHLMGQAEAWRDQGPGGNGSAADRPGDARSPAADGAGQLSHRAAVVQGDIPQPAAQRVMAAARGCRVAAAVRQRGICHGAPHNVRASIAATM